MLRTILSTLALLMLAACGRSGEAQSQSPRAGLAEAVFAGGCFWCTEADFEKLPGVVEAISGYTGGRTPNPTYEQVLTETTGHREAVLVRFDPAIISYRALVDHYWRTVDPTDAGGQFCDRGESYTTAVFVTAQQRAAAEASKAAAAAAARLPGPIVTPILDRQTFYPAEAYHQDFAEKNVVRYRLYRSGCGRDARLAQLWR